MEGEDGRKYVRCNIGGVLEWFRPTWKGSFGILPVRGGGGWEREILEES
jgi:hypothetical protein